MPPNQIAREELVGGAAPGRSRSAGLTRAVARAAAALGLRQLLVQGLNLVGTVLLARLLTPTQFGLYAIITFLVTFLTSLAGSGLAANLVRQPEEPREGDYRTMFSVQLAVALTLAATLWLAAPYVTRAYALPASDVALFRLLAASLLITSFIVIPQVRLERGLAFDRLAMVEVGQAAAFNGCAVVLAWLGWGTLSFGIALLLRSATGAVLANALSPWRVSWAWDRETAWRHLRFGFPYQGSVLVSAIKDSIGPLFVGLLLGTSEVGYLAWAGTIAAYPVMALMVLQRIYLPLFARLQADRRELRVAVERVLTATNGIVAPLAALTLVMIEPITRLVFGEKWIVALPFFYLFWVANGFVATATPLVGLLNALGRSATTFGFALLWMFGTWALGLPLVMLYGPIGLPIANVGVQLTNVLLYRVARAEVSFRVAPAIARIWGWAAVAALAARLLEHLLPATDLLRLAVCLTAGLAVYVGGVVITWPDVFRRA